MARRIRCSDAGFVHHVLNRAVGRATVFDKSADYAAFEKVLRQAWERTQMRLLAYVLLPNHWHLVVWPRHDGQLSTYAQWLTVTHVRRWHAHHHTEGTGPVYQGRFKSFPVQADNHFLSLCRYVERNGLRAGLVPSAEQWRWSSLWHRCHATGVLWLHDWPVPRPESWLRYVNKPETERELTALRRSVLRGAPYGDELWQQQTAKVLGLESALRSPGRPRQQKETRKNLTNLTLLLWRGRWPKGAHFG
jgi:putative transposase